MKNIHSGTFPACQLSGCQCYCNAKFNVYTALNTIFLRISCRIFTPQDFGKSGANVIVSFAIYYKKSRKTYIIKYCCCTLRGFDQVSCYIGSSFVRIVHPVCML